MTKRLFIFSFLCSAFAFGCTDDTIKIGGACLDENCENTCDGDDCEDESSVCGDGVVSGREACDEGTAHSQGCAKDCMSITAGWECKTPGKKCTKLKCGNGELDAGEVCDEGQTPTDGCVENCTKITEGWTCDRVGEACVGPFCGDGVVNEGEACDKGERNSKSSYGRKGECRDNCTWMPYCGDGVPNYDKEMCDVGADALPSGSPEMETGYNLCDEFCRFSKFYCGDKQITNEERCDDGNSVGGDGCSADCQIEQGFYCVTPGEACIQFKCGNGILDDKETCDDGNRVDGDGCSTACQREDGWDCVTPGEACVEITCDSATGKTCDDGNRVDGDGCSSKCQIEKGWICPDSVKCYVAGCGDGVAVGTEECDDGNSVAGDGCNAYCRLESGFVCPDGGGKCHSTVCGDGVVEGDETCDEGTLTTPANKTSGCVECRTQIGWQCKTPGASCTNDASCGNGILEGAEECDEGDHTTAGCVGCLITTGWRCPTVGAACIQGKCGDGELDKGEACDDGNYEAGDGCDPVCKHEAIFTCGKDGSCRPVCGDDVTMWMIDPEVREECDDGNTVSGDGCSSDCKVETGWECTDFEAPMPDYIEVPANYYDFVNYTHSGSGDGFISQAFYNSLVKMDKECSGRMDVGKGFPDFQRWGGSGCDGMVKPMLDSDGKPVLNSINTACTNSPASSPNVKDHLSCGRTFHYWYRYEPGINRVVHSRLMMFLKDRDKSMYQFYSAVPCSDFACNEGAIWAKTTKGEPMPLDNFVPINKDGYCEAPNTIPSPCSANDEGGFTTEITTYFMYRGGEELEFHGNDDVWVFLNNHLFVDLGGMQASRDKKGILAAEPFGDTGRVYDKRYDVYQGGVYAVKLFNAERMMSGSSFQLSLSGFVNAGHAKCEATCGDGIMVGPEECDIKGHVDDEEAHKAGCVHCVKTPYCPNGVREGSEECDGEAWCSDTCKFTDSTCGDGTVEGHEQCDEGANNGQPGATCAINCMKIGCGNGIVEASEACDDGNEVNDDNCSNACQRPKCGDNIVQAWMGEVCDDGVNDGNYNGCGLGCTYLTPRCGDAIIQTDEGEQCDLGSAKNTGDYGTCTPDCQMTDRCGDGKLQPEFENCDDGELNGEPGHCPKNCVYVVY